jgi:hypothetical protein
MNISTKNIKSTNEPMLEAFGLKDSIYSDFKRNKQSLEKIESESDAIIKSVDSNSFIVLLYILGIFGLTAFIVWLGLVFSKSFIGSWSWMLMYFLWWIIISKTELDVIENLLSLGVYRKAKMLKKETADKIKNLTESTKNAVGSFEESFHEYYQNKLDEFYSDRLYKKRSGTLEFEASLSEFELIIDNLSSVNDIFLTKHFSLWRYVEYLNKRRTDNTIQQEKALIKEFKPIGDFIGKVSQSKTVQEVSMAPEIKYRIPRKINWESINKDREKTGLKGEEIIVAMEKKYLESIDRNDLADKVRHVSVEEGDGLGYDVFSFFPDGRVKYIEVKSTTSSIDSQYYISRNELEFLREHSEDAFIYRVQLSHENDDTFLQVKTGSDILHDCDIVPVQYTVKMKKD